MILSSHKVKEAAYKYVLNIHFNQKSIKFKVRTTINTYSVANGNKFLLLIIKGKSYIYNDFRKGNL